VRYLSVCVTMMCLPSNGQRKLDAMNCAYSSRYSGSHGVAGYKIWIGACNSM
jgi:hypothetical protein